ncbi:lipase member H-like [Cydia amplana]|uniref:lipase member H-like n=1 Tax=Cydia amplana TaxID=1869771 RepID=UPI002FE5B11C
MRLISGTLLSTPSHWLPVLSRIAPPDLRRKEALMREAVKIQKNPALLIHAEFMSPANCRLKSRNASYSIFKGLVDTCFNLKREWSQSWNSLMAGKLGSGITPGAIIKGSDLPRRHWCNLNRLRTGHGRCAYYKHRCGWVESPACICGETAQTIQHIIEDCPITRYANGPPEDLIVLNDEATNWCRLVKFRNMWRINLVFVAATCISCECASLAETGVGSRSPRFTNVRYFRTSWEHMVSGVDLEEVENSAQGATSLALDGTENVAIIVHGRESSVYSDFGSSVRYSLAMADLVIIMVDWSYLSFSSYELAVATVPFIAADLRAFIVFLADAGLNLSRLHLIGFDLGAHIVGIANRNAAARAVKITALDPAGALWGASSQRLRASDANYVEVIHTDISGTRAFGTADALGTLDIYPNGGTRQPGCSNSDNACHHNRAWEFFAATVDTGGHLMALRCDSMTQVGNNRCIGTPAVLMGTLTLIKLQTGLYRVNTGNTYPFNA